MSFTMEMQSIARLCEVYKLLCAQEPFLLSYDYRNKENAAIWRKKSQFRAAGGVVGEVGGGVVGGIGGVVGVEGGSSGVGVVVGEGVV